jgi:hypothetical protein
MPVARQSGNGSTEPQPTIYCVVPHELSELSEPLTRHFSGDSKLEVVMEQRRGDRRRGNDRRNDRRKAAGRPAAGVERRLAHELEGRRFGERRAKLLPVEEQPALPPDLYCYADQLSFVRRLDGSTPYLDVARVREMAAQWRERCRDAEREATGLLRALVGVADDLGRLRTWSPRRFMAVHRAQRTIERYRQGHLVGAHASGADGAAAAGAYGAAAAGVAKGAAAATPPVQAE